MHGNVLLCETAFDDGVGEHRVGRRDTRGDAERFEKSEAREKGKDESTGNEPGARHDEKEECRERLPRMSEIRSESIAEHGEPASTSREFALSTDFGRAIPVNRTCMPMTILQNYIAQPASFSFPEVAFPDLRSHAYFVCEPVYSDGGTS